MPVVSISLPESLLAAVDELVQRLGYTGRSELVREALREFIRTRSPARSGPGCAVFVVVTDNRRWPGADRRVIEVLHEVADAVRSISHVLLEQGVCVTTAILKGDWALIEQAAKRLRGVKGVESLWLLPVEAG